MTFPILGGNGAVAGYSIDNSVRLDDGSNAHLSKTFGSSGNRKTFTFSCWSKGQADTSSYHSLFTAGSDNPDTVIWFTPDEKLRTTTYNSGSIYLLDSQAIYRDASAWYHIVVAYDTTQATASNRIKMYVNGEEIAVSGSYPSQNYDTFINNSSYTHRVGSHTSSAYAGDGYMAEVNFIDGQALSPTDFGEFDEDSGIWKPIQYTGTYGTNGFYLDFENSGSLGADQSGNGNNFTPTNLASTDQTTDTPTNNFCTFNPLARNNGNTYTEGNTVYDYSNNFMRNGVATMGMSSGKWYAEFQKSDATTIHLFGVVAENYVSDGRTVTDTSGNNDYGRGHTGTLYLQSYNSGQDIYQDGSDTGTNVDFTSTTDDIIMVAFDVDTKKIWFGKNGTWSSSGNPATGSNPSHTYSGTGEAPFYFSVGTENTSPIRANFGNPPFSISSGNSDDNGYGNFEYAPPSGYLALCTQNLATALSPTIDDGSAYFQTKTYSGNGVETAITNDGNSNLQPDLIWFKARSAVYYHGLFDSTRGTELRLSSNVTDAEVTKSSAFTSFDSNGFTVGADVSNTTNASGQTFVAWQWKANGGTTSSNTDGSITSTVQANTTAGFSIVTYTGTGSAGSVGHGLGVAPKWVLPKSRNATDGWASWHTGLSGSGYIISLQATSAEFNNGTASFSDFPSSSVINFGGDYSVSGRTYVVYCFAEIEGYSKFGSYTGNGSTDGVFIYLGFRPAWVMIKRYDSTGGAAWYIFDNKRNTFNVVKNRLVAQDVDTEATNFDALDFLSNGFKFRNNDQGWNTSGGTYIYMAFAESPFCTSTGIPVTAR